MTPEIKKRIEEAREEIGNAVINCGKDVEEMLKDKVFAFSEQAFCGYLFPDKVSGSPCDDGEEDNDFYLRGYMLQLCFDPVPRIQVTYGNWNIEHPNEINPKPQLRDWGSEVENEILDLIESRILAKKGGDLNSEEMIDVWVVKGGLYRKDNVYLLTAPAYLFGKVSLIRCTRSAGAEEKEKVNGPEKGEIKICDIWTMIKALIGVC